LRATVLKYTLRSVSRPVVPFRWSPIPFNILCSVSKVIFLLNSWLLWLRMFHWRKYGLGYSIYLMSEAMLIFRVRDRSMFYQLSWILVSARLAHNCWEFYLSERRVICQAQNWIVFYCRSHRRPSEGSINEQMTKISL
jgi:hypothetical protein